MQHLRIGFGATIRFCVVLVANYADAKRTVVM